MTEDRPISHESPAVRTHLEIVQGVIQRMAENSRSCKVWCVTLVSAILVLVARTGKAEHAMIAVAPTVLFLVLDAYYLSLEGAFRKSYDAFVITGSEFYNPRLIPPRLADNGQGRDPYALMYRWPQPWAPAQIADWIHRAFLRRQGTPPENARKSFGRNWTRRKCSEGWQN